MTNLGRGARSGGETKSKRSKKGEKKGARKKKKPSAAEQNRALTRENGALKRKVAEVTRERDLSRARSVLAAGNLVGQRRRKRTRAAGADGEDEEMGELTEEPAADRRQRLETETAEVKNEHGRSRSFEENRTFIHVALKMEQQVLEKCDRDEQPSLKKIANHTATMLGYDTAFGQELMANWRAEKSVLVHESQLRGKGSPGYANGDFIDTARRLSPEHLREMEAFRAKSHKEGGVVSVRTVCEHLTETFGSPPGPAGADASPSASPSDQQDGASETDHRSLLIQPRRSPTHLASAQGKSCSPGGACGTPCATTSGGVGGR